MRKQFFFSETNLFKESMKKFVCIVNEQKRLIMNWKMMALTFFEFYTEYIKN